MSIVSQESLQRQLEELGLRTRCQAQKHGGRDVLQGPKIASLFHDVADLGLLEAQKIGAIVYILWHIATYVRSWLQNLRKEARLVEFDLGFWICG